MPERVNDSVTISKKSAVVWISVLAAIIFAVGLGLWWQNIRMNSTNVFWGMVDNNLATASVTKQIVQEGEGQKLNQIVRVNLGQNNIAQGKVTINQDQGDVKTTVKTESIGTPDADYNRYTHIDSGQKAKDGSAVDVSNIEGVWAKTETGNGGQQPQSNAQYFSQSILGIIPIANFYRSQRQEIIKFMKDKNVYDISSGNVKSENVDGRNSYVYEVSVNPQAYIEAMVEITKRMGLGDIGLDVGQYAGSPVVRAEVSVDKLSRHLVKIKYTATGQEERYSAYGVKFATEVPQTHIPISELQERLQKVLQ